MIPEAYIRQQRGLLREADGVLVRTRNTVLHFRRLLAPNYQIG